MASFNLEFKESEGGRGANSEENILSLGFQHYRTDIKHGRDTIVVQKKPFHLTTSDIQIAISLRS